MSGQLGIILRYGLIGNIFFIFVIVPFAQIIGINLTLSSNFLPEIAASAFCGTVLYCLALPAFINSFLTRLLLIRGNLTDFLLEIISIFTLGFIKANAQRSKIEKIQQIINSIQRQTLSPSGQGEVKNDIGVPFSVFLHIWQQDLPEPSRQKLFNINSFFVFSANMVITLFIYLFLIMVLWIVRGGPTKIPVEIVPYHIYMPDVSGEYCTIITLFLFFLFSAVVGSSYSQRWNEVLILFLKKQGEEAARLTFEVISKGGSAIRHYRNFIE